MPEGMVDGNELVLVGIPDLCRAVQARGQDATAVRAVADIVHGLAMLQAGRTLLACGEVPDLGCSIVAAGDEEFLIRAEIGAVHPALVHQRGPFLAASRGVPESGRVIGACGDGPRSGRAELGKKCVSIMAWQTTHLRSRR